MAKTISSYRSSESELPKSLILFQNSINLAKYSIYINNNFCGESPEKSVIFFDSSDGS